MTRSPLIGLIGLITINLATPACSDDEPQQPPTEKPAPAVDRAKLTIMSPTEGSVIDQERVMITISATQADLVAYGVALDGAALMRQDLELMAGDTHSFELKLKPGLNTIVIATFDKLGESDREDLVLLYDVGDKPTISLAQDLDGLTTFEPSVELNGVAQGQRPLSSLELLINGVSREKLIAQGDDPKQLDFSLPVALTPGMNAIELIVTDEGGLTSSTTLTITRQRDEHAPELKLQWPRQGQSVLTKRVLVRGTVADEDQIDEVSLSYNDQIIQATVEPNGAWAAWLELDAAGEHSFEVRATDRVGQQAKLPSTLHFGATLAAGGAHGGLLRQGQLWSWGRNNKGQTGLGYTSTLTDGDIHPIEATALTGLMEPLESIAFSQNASIALSAAGELWAWGDNANGQLCMGQDAQGQPDTDDRLIPTKAPGLTSIVAIARGYSHTLLLKSDGTVWACGKNTSGQLGDGTTDASSSAVQVAGLSDIVHISAGSESSFAVDAQGVLWAWGRNRYGNLGQGTEDTEAHPAPSSVQGVGEVVMVANGRDHTLALLANGEVWGWGLNASAQAGQADTESNVTSPSKLSLALSAVAVHANGNQSFFEDIQGRLWGWGQNGLGNLGIPQEEDQPAAIAPVFGLEGLTDAVIGPLHGFARADEDTILAWGWSFEGSLGGGESIINRWGYRIPVLVQLNKEEAAP